jgi:hypothetical protein
MIEVTQIIKIKHSPVFNIGEDKEERNCIMAIGKIKDILFLIKIADNKNVNVKSKKYLKKKDLSLIIEKMDILKSDEDSEVIEVLDFMDRTYDYAQSEIDLKFNELSDIFKNM